MVKCWLESHIFFVLLFFCVWLQQWKKKTTFYQKLSFIQMLDHLANIRQQQKKNHWLKCQTLQYQDRDWIAFYIEKKGENKQTRAKKSHKRQRHAVYIRISRRALLNCHLHPEPNRAAQCNTMITKNFVVERGIQGLRGERSELGIFAKRPFFGSCRWKKKSWYKIVCHVWCFESGIWFRCRSEKPNEKRGKKIYYAKIFYFWEKGCQWEIYYFSKYNSTV